LYAASEINYRSGNQMINLKMETQFPYDPEVRIIVGNEHPVKNKIYIRIPSWASKAMAVTVNNKECGKGKPGSYLLVDRKWKNGDKISFILPMDFRVTEYKGMEKGYEKNHYAVEYGPILMAMVGVKGKKTDVGVKATPESIKTMLKKVSGKPLHFTIEGNTEFEYWPYFEVQEEPFSCFPEFY